MRRWRQETQQAGNAEFNMATRNATGNAEFNMATRNGTGNAEFNMIDLFSIPNFKKLEQLLIFRLV